MGGESIFIKAVKVVIVYLSPFVFLEGLLLLLARNRYDDIEKKLNKEIGSLRKKVIPPLENNIYTLHNWLLKKNFFIGLFFVIYSILTFIALKDYLKFSF